MEDLRPCVNLLEKIRPDVFFHEQASEPLRHRFKPGFQRGTQHVRLSDGIGNMLGQFGTTISI